MAGGAGMCKKGSLLLTGVSRLRDLHSALRVTSFKLQTFGVGSVELSNHYICLLWFRNEPTVAVLMLTADSVFFS